MVDPVEIIVVCIPNSKWLLVKKILAIWTYSIAISQFFQWSNDDQHPMVSPLWVKVPFISHHLGLRSRLAVPSIPGILVILFLSDSLHVPWSSVNVWPSIPWWESWNRRSGRSKEPSWITIVGYVSHDTVSPWYCHWLVVSTPLKNMSQMGLVFPACVKNTFQATNQIESSKTGESL